MSLLDAACQSACHGTHAGSAAERTTFLSKVTQKRAAEPNRKQLRVLQQL